MYITPINWATQEGQITGLDCTGLRENTQVLHVLDYSASRLHFDSWVFWAGLQTMIDHSLAPLHYARGETFQCSPV